jgi:hypothetical protein
VRGGLLGDVGWINRELDRGVAQELGAAWGSGSENQRHAS